MPLVAGLSPRRSDHTVFVVDKVALGQVFLRVLRFSLSISCHWGSMLIYHVRAEEMAHWWPQFRDTAPLHQHDQQQSAAKSL
jgi:hypothetical protein